MPQLLHYLRVDRNTRLADAAKKDSSALSPQQEEPASFADDVFVNSTDKVNVSDVDTG